MTQGTLTFAVQQVVARKSTWVELGAVCGVAGVMALAGQVRIPLPFTPVPLTLQTMLVLLSGIVLGARTGALGQVLYVGLGAMGLGVFAGGTSGLSGATAGYLVGFVAAAAVVGLLTREPSPARVGVGLLAGTLVIYLFGAGWLVLGLGRSATEGITLGVIPFLPGDAMKLVVAGMLAQPLRAVWGRIRGA